LISTQVLIAGQGLAGSLLAWELWHQGLDFRVMDPGEQHTSSKAAAGLFHPLVARKIRQAAGVEEMLPAMKAAYSALEKELEVKLLHEIPSAKLISIEEAPLWEMAIEGALKPYVRSIIPSGDIKGLKNGLAGVIACHSGFLEVSGLIYGMARWLSEKNLLIPEKLDYESIRLEPGKVVIDGFAEAQTIVFCEGPAGMSNPWFGQAGLSVNKGEVIEILAPELDERFIIRGEVFLLPLGMGRFRVGATYSRNPVNNEPSTAGLAELTEKLEKIISVPYKVADHWAGIRPVTRDRQPILGFHPRHPQLAIFNGLGSKGVMQAPLRAMQMRKLFTENGIKRGCSVS
jgi:glycine/D-amino acid oxidase-like deaminating enzyme